MVRKWWENGENDLQNGQNDLQNGQNDLQNGQNDLQNGQNDAKSGHLVKCDFSRHFPLFLLLLRLKGRSFIPHLLPPLNFK